MRKTTKYQLNLIDPSDDFSAEPLNENAQKFETALTEQDQRIADTAAQRRFFTLGKPVVTTNANQTIQFNLSDVDMSEYQCLLLRASGEATGGKMMMSMNNANDMTLFTAGNDRFGVIAWLFPVPSSRVAVLGHVVSHTTLISPGAVPAVNSIGGMPSLGWTSITSISVSGIYSAGASATLYGIKG